MKVLTIFGKIILLSVILAIGLVISRIILFELGANIPRLPQQADENIAIYYLLAGSLLLAGGWFFLIKGIGGSIKHRFLISMLFLLIGFSVGVTIESAIYSDIGLNQLTIVLLILPVLLYSIAASLMTDSKKPLASFKDQLISYFKKWPTGIWLRKIILAIISFPVIYFIFGIIAAPFVTGYYADNIEGLVLPKPETIVFVQLIRSIMFLFVTIPVVINWTSTRTRLVVSLSMAHFVMVFSYDIYLAIVMPIELVLIHGIEIMADSYVYSWIMVRLLWPKLRAPKNVQEE